MSFSLKSLGIEQRSVAERLVLVEELWDSISAATPVTGAQRAEFDSAALWYEESQSGPGAQFTSEIDHAVALAAAHPDR